MPPFAWTAPASPPISIGPDADGCSVDYRKPEPSPPAPDPAEQHARILVTHRPLMADAIRYAAIGALVAILSVGFVGLVATVVR